MSKEIRTGKYVLVYDSDETIQLKIEVSRHPFLMQKLEESKEKEFPQQLAIIATYCGILVDGYYNEKQLKVICEALIQDLRQKRTGIILSSH